MAGRRGNHSTGECLCSDYQHHTESQDVSSKSVENMFDEDGKEQGGEEEAGKKRKRTAVEEVEKHSRSKAPEDRSQKSSTGLDDGAQAAGG